MKFTLKKNYSLIAIFALLTVTSLALTACQPDNPEDPQRTGKSTLHIQPKIIQALKPEEKQKLVDTLNNAAKKEDYETFATTLAQIYQSGHEGDQDFNKIESDLYIKGTEYFLEDLVDRAYKMSDTIYAKVFESWRFKYLRIRCLEKYGNDAFAKGDLAKATEYAQKIMAVEFRPEGVNLQAKIYIKQAQDAIKAGDLNKAKSIVVMTNDMQIDPALRKQIDEIAKSLGL